MADITDAALVAAALTGDRSAHAALVERHALVCRRVLDDPSQAGDAVQEAVLWGLLDLDRLRRPDRFGPWPAGIGLDACRRELRRRVPQAACAVPETADPGPGPVDLAEAGQRVAAGFYLRELSRAALGVGVGAVEASTRRAQACAGRWTTWWKDRSRLPIWIGARGRGPGGRTDRHRPSAPADLPVRGGRAGRRGIDARPGDALNLALEVGAAILVEPAVLDDLGRRERPQVLPDLPGGGRRCGRPVAG